MYLGWDGKVFIGYLGQDRTFQNSYTLHKLMMHYGVLIAGCDKRERQRLTETELTCLPVTVVGALCDFFFVFDVVIMLLIFRPRCVFNVCIDAVRASYFKSF